MNLSSPLFTVIITTYNRRDLVPRAIQSVLHQTYGDFELLLIDNGSTDDTRTIVQSIQDPRIKYILNPNPSHSCDAPRNLGIHLAQGTFISFLDDDDIWYPKKLEKVKEAFDHYPDVDAVCHDENKRTNGHSDGILRYGPWIDSFYEKLLYEGNCLSPSAMTLKTNLLRSLNGFRIKEEYFRAADYDFWLRMAKKGVKIYFLEEILGEFSITGINLSLLDSTFHLKVAHIVQDHLLSYEGKSLLNLSRRGLWRIVHLYMLALRAFLNKGEIKNVFKYSLHVGLMFFIRPLLILNLCSRLLKVQS